MAAIVVKNFGGISPRVPPRYLQDNQAQVALNCPVFTGPLTSLPGVSASAIVSLTSAGTPTTIYRYGQDVDSDERYWFSWNFDVDICRGQIAGDPVEWTFYTGDGPPKATYNTIALASSPYPAQTIPLGVPNPKTSLQATVPAFTAASYAAELILDPSALANLTTAGLEISLNDGTTYTTVTLPSLPTTNRATYVKDRINALVTGVTATVDLNSVLVNTTATGPTATILFRGITGTATSYDTTGSFTYNALDLSASGTTRDQPLLVIKQSQWASIDSTLQVRLVATNTSGVLTTVFNKLAPTPFTSAADFATWLNANFVSPYGGALTVAAYGGSVIVTPAIYGQSTASPSVVGKLNIILGAADTPEETKYPVSAAKDTAGTARIILTLADFNSYVKGKFYGLTLNSGSENKIEVSSNSTLFLSIPECSITPLGDDSSALLIETSTRGTTANIRFRGGVYPTTTTNAYFTLSAAGYTDTTSVPESRVYTYTWVSKVSGFEFESGPADPSLSVDVYKDQSVTLSNFEPAGGYIGYILTARRIYRSVNGVYLFVAEIPSAQTSYVDEISPDDLSEEMPVTGWAEPPKTLSGLINLPNGLMAGFVGRDIYLCDPYHPHAWPEAYVQTVDYPVVGLGRMDTTLVVLTKGVPYFIQGSHPDSMVVVKSDIEQSCASKRSIVSYSGVVMYASPDGLVMLSSGGSKLITDTMFTRAQWQSFVPTSIHAYHHDNKYVAFYDTGTVQGGFVYDFISQQFITHNLYATAGFSDLLRDQLFLAFSNNTIKKWYDGANLSYIWRSKVFSMPFIMGFSYAKIESETYPVTAKFYFDDSTTPFHTQTVASRDAFRLPVKEGRDFEMQLEGTSTVFSIAVSQAIEELG